MFESEQRVPWYAYPLFPLVLLLLIPAALLSIPFAYLMAGLQSIDEKRFYRRMRERGRFIESADLAPAMRTGSGTSWSTTGAGRRFCSCASRGMRDN